MELIKKLKNIGKDFVFASAVTALAFGLDIYHTLHDADIYSVCTKNNSCQVYCNDVESGFYTRFPLTRFVDENNDGNLDYVQTLFLLRKPNNEETRLYHRLINNLNKSGGIENATKRI